MSLQIVTALNSVGMAWITTKVPQFCRLIARRQRARLDELFRTTLRQSLFFLAAGGVLAVLFAALARATRRGSAIGSFPSRCSRRCASSASPITSFSPRRRICARTSRSRS